MKKIQFALLMMITNLANAQTVMPISYKEEIQDEYFGKTIKDQYRWLENDHAEVTKSWVEEQNAYTESVLNKIPHRETVKQDLTNLWNYAKYSSPSKEGYYYLFYKNDGLQNQSVLYIQRGTKEAPTVFIDPNKLNENGTSSLGAVELSKKQKRCAYAVSNAGSDWQDIYVMDVATKKIIADKIEYTKFSGIAWVGDEGFYYSGYDKPQNDAQKFSAKTEYQKIFFHTIGTKQSQDKLIYEDKLNPLRYKGVGISDDERWLMMSVSEGTDGSELYYWDLKNKDQQAFKLLSKGFDINQDFIDVINDKFLIYTNANAPNYQLVLVDPNNPSRKKWIPFIAEKTEKLDAVSRVGNKLFCSYLEKACSKIDVYTVEGKFEKTLKLPGLGTVTGFGGSPKDNHTFYTYTSYNSPPTIYKYDLTTGESKVFKNSEVKTSLDNTVVEQLWFTSKDGTKVPMFVYHRKDMPLGESPMPVLLYGYGGFNISLTPTFSIPTSYFVQQGGAYVVVNLRGGSEFGEKWHQGGMLANKQNVFDDFIGAAEYLIKQGITTNDKLAIHGRSNGGLLVGACMTQRPELFKVALPGVGVLDMLRYHKFTVGWGWAVEYGSSDAEKDFNYLIKYSPLHNIKENVMYPCTLITTADHDDRVVPAHSFKFAAALQEVNTFEGANPIVIRIDTQAGHGAGKPTSKQIDEWADVLSFTMFHLGMSVK
jgi:prolyl oligopeptidase